MTSEQSTTIQQFPSRLHGIDLKTAEQITRRLLLNDSCIPIYHLLPPIQHELSSTITDFLYHNGFESIPKCLSTSIPNNPKRGEKKRQQIKNIINALCILITSKNENLHIVDLCGGCGHIGLVIAILFPKSKVTIIDKNHFALSIAVKKAKQLSLSNLFTHCINIQDIDFKYDIAIALHACGGASDIALQYSMKIDAKMIIIPCCIGGIVTNKGSVTGCANDQSNILNCIDDSIQWEIARSEIFRQYINKHQYISLARTADFAQDNNNIYQDDWRYLTTSLINWDRVLWLRQSNINVYMVKMKPLTCTPKNDIIIAWPNNKNHQVNNLNWPIDNITNGFITDIQESNIIHGFSSFQIEQVQNILTNMVTLSDSKGIYNTPTGMGKRKRKLYHAVAESMGLWHQSYGKGIERIVTIRKTQWWPLFFDSYVAIGGPKVDQLASLLQQVVPTEFVKRKIQLRGNPHHITIVGPKEVSKLPSLLKKDRQECLKHLYQIISDTQFKIVGVGRVQGKDDNQAYFGVVQWPEVQQFRIQMGLQVTDLHITLGFKVKDIHDQKKGLTSVFWKQEEICSPWI